MSKIHGELDNSQFNMAICHVAPVHSQVTALAFLSYYLQNRDKKGIFISTLRPHYYIQRLLLKERLPVDELVMIDAIYRFGDGTTSESHGPSSGSMDGTSPLVLQDHVLEKVYHAMDDPRIEFIVQGCSHTFQKRRPSNC